MTAYTIYIRSNEHPRTINTPAMARTYFTAFRVQSKAELYEMVSRLRSVGECITEIRSNIGAYIYC